MAGVAVLKLKHVGINKTLTMPVVIVSYETQAKPNWASTQVYGRMDPIFTYQNTVRSFVAVLRTPRSGEVLTTEQKNVFTSAEGGKAAGAFDAAGSKWKYKGNQKSYLRDIADLYKMMYPVYAPIANNRSTGFMVASPLMTLRLAGIAYDGLSGAGASNLGDGMLFVPETFKVNSLIDSKRTSITVSSAENLRFFANAEGYTITLGGTVLHKNNRVGFEMVGNTATFGQGTNFPYNTGGESMFGDPLEAVGGYSPEDVGPDASERARTHVETYGPCAGAATSLQQLNDILLDNPAMLGPDYDFDWGARRVEQTRLLEKCMKDHGRSQ